MKKFRVDVWEEVTYTKIFEAETKEQAEDIARQEIEVVGCDDWKTGSHTDFDVVAVEEVKWT